MKEEFKIQLCGPSGVGKTTLSKHISKHLEIPFVDGSYSQLVPSTKNMKHQKMIDRDPSDIYKEYITLVQERVKAFGLNPSYISDRSFLDVLIYTIDILSSKLESCDIDFMNNLCKNMLLSNCSHLILLEYPASFIKEIPIEDNRKRIINPFYQWKISELFLYVLRDLWRCPIFKSKNGGLVGEIFAEDSDDSNRTKVLVIPYWDFELRVKMVNSFLNDLT